MGRKKKEPVIVVEEKAPVVKSKKITKTEIWPKVTTGTHLTVYTFEDGSTDLIWDDEALLRDVRAAISTVEANKTSGRKKKKSDSAA